MRCPKCGFISFDQLSSCAKCSKPINLDKLKLNGMVYNVAAPNYLSGGHEGDEDNDVSFAETIAVDENFEGDSELDFAPTSDDDLDFDQDDFDEDDFTLDTADDDDGIEMNLNDFEDSQDSDIDFSAPEMETGDDDFDLDMTTDDETITPDFSLDMEEDKTEELDAIDLVMDDSSEEQSEPASGLEMELEIEDGSAGEENTESPELNLGDIDLSDLDAAPQQEQPAQDDFATDFTLGDVFDDEPAAPQPPKPPVQVKADGADLEDLQMGDLEIDSGKSADAKPKANGKSAKTGTALDDFEIDLGDLLSKD